MPIKKKDKKKVSTIEVKNENNEIKSEDEVIENFQQKPKEVKVNKVEFKKEKSEIQKLIESLPRVITIEKNKKPCSIIREDYEMWYNLGYRIKK